MELKGVSVDRCTFLVVSTLLISTGWAQECCPSLWTSFDDHCYRYFGNPTSWSEAEAHCISTSSTVGKEGHLVSIHSDNENVFVYELWQSSITPSGENTEEVNKGNSLWIGFKNLSRGFEWSDGSESSYTFWKENGLNTNGMACVHTGNESRWNGVQCTTTLPFVCKLDPNSPVNQTIQTLHTLEEREQLQHYVCEHQTLHLECREGEVLSIEYANYGRTNREICSDNPWNTDADTCRTYNTKSILDANCEGNRVCDVPATNQMFGNPCGNVFKYLDVTYKCLENPSTRAFVCEHQTLHLECNEGEDLVIHSANYGRLHRNVCSNNGWNKNTDSCRSDTALGIVRHACNNQQSCDVPATNGQFGNPCGDIFKYLEVEYSCEEQEQLRPEIMISEREQLQHHVCEHQTLHLECSIGEVLSIEYANYGRTNREICSDIPWNTDADTCRTYNTKSILDANCEGNRVCDVPATNQMFGNPCGNVFKYLDVTYKCLENPSTRAYVCEHQTLHLECNEGEGLVIHSANYGRLHRNVCSNNGWNKNTDSCRSDTALSIVRHACNNQRSCDVPATNGQFGNPCGDIFKYLEVEYSCKAVDTPEHQYQHACEDETLHLECDHGQGIAILSANFGRLNRAICSDNFWYTDTDTCYSATALSIVRSNCETYQMCDVGATSAVFGYPCSGVFKYAEVTYKCQEREQLRRHVCEHENLHLECREGEVLSIEYANYGRTDRDVCTNNQWNHDADTCRTYNTKSILDANCEGCRVCDVTANNQMFGNPCGNVFKYLDVTYKCLEKPSTRVLVCEHQTLHLECNEGEGLVIHSANYGRLHRNVCSNNDWNKNTDSCRSDTALGIVRHACNNQRACDVPATNGQFGNPCGDIFKYLEVEYSCADIIAPTVIL